MLPKITRYFFCSHYTTRYQISMTPAPILLMFGLYHESGSQIPGVNKSIQRSMGNLLNIIAILAQVRP